VCMFLSQDWSVVKEIMNMHIPGITRGDSHFLDNI